MKEEIEKLEKEVRELKEELKFTKVVEMEAVVRYEKVVNELLTYYDRYGKLGVKEKKKK
jgi:hypothetical protein